MKKMNWHKRKSLGIRGLLSIIKIEFEAMRSNKQIIYQQILNPILNFIFIGYALSKTIGNVNYEGQELPYFDYSFTGILSMILFSQMYHSVYRMINDRRSGLLSYKFYMGVNSYDYIIGMSTLPSIGLIIQTIVLYIIGLLFGLNISLIQIIIASLLLILFEVFWCSFGMILALWINDYKTRDLVLNMVIMPLSFSAPSFYILEDAGKIIQYLAKINPLYYNLNAIRDMVFNFRIGNNFYISLGILFISFILCNYLMRTIEFKSKEFN